MALWPGGGGIDEWPGAAVAVRTSDTVALLGQADQRHRLAHAGHHAFGDSRPSSSTNSSLTPRSLSSCDDGHRAAQAADLLVVPDHEVDRAPGLKPAFSQHLQRLELRDQVALVVPACRGPRRSRPTVRRRGRLFPVASVPGATGTTSWCAISDRPPAGRCRARCRAGCGRHHLAFQHRVGLAGSAPSAAHAIVELAGVAGRVEQAWLMVRGAPRRPGAAQRRPRPPPAAPAAAPPAGASPGAACWPPARRPAAAPAASRPSSSRLIIRVLS
jgi:hypothetical protein